MFLGQTALRVGADFMSTKWLTLLVLFAWMSFLIVKLAYLIRHALFAL